MIHLDKAASAINYTFEQYKEENNQKRQNFFMETLIVVFMIVVGAVGLYLTFSDPTTATTPFM
jgi:hypothetical protein